MKTLICSLALLALTPLAALADAPPVSAKQALEIAEKSLKERNLSASVYIESLQMDHSSMMGGHQFWFVKWSKTLPASNPRNKEVGIKVYMDGHAVRLVKEPGTP
jgi:hypothetical protein